MTISISPRSLTPPVRPEIARVATPMMPQSTSVARPPTAPIDVFEPAPGDTRALDTVQAMVRSVISDPSALEQTRAYVSWLETRDPQAIEALALLTSAPLATGIDRNALFLSVIRELDAPQSISQGNQNTCGAASVAVALATYRPAEFVRAVTGLASPGGRIAMTSGTLVRVKRPDPNDERTVSQRLIQDALMDLGNGPLLTFGGKGGKNGILGVGLVPGAPPKAVVRMMEAVFGRDMSKTGSLLKKAGRCDVEAVRRLVDAHEPVLVLVRNKKLVPGQPALALHWMMVTSINDKTVRLVLNNGAAMTFDRTSFDRSLKAFIGPANIDHSAERIVSKSTRSEREGRNDDSDMTE